MKDGDKALGCGELTETTVFMLLGQMRLAG